MRRLAETSPGHNLQGLRSENGEEKRKNDKRFRVSGAGEGLTPKVEEMRVSVEVDAENVPLQMLMRKNDKSRVSGGVKMLESESLGGGEMKPPEARVVENKKGGVDMPSLQSSCSGADDEEDNIPIGKILIRSKAGDHQKIKQKDFQNMEDIDDNTPLKNSIAVKEGRILKKSIALKEGKNRDKAIQESGYDVNLTSKFREGDMVWAKVKSHPWWPGQVYNPAFASAMARSKRKSGHMLIAFFGDSSYGWFMESDLVPFEPNYDQKSKQSTSRTFTKAVEESVDELGRRAALGLTCPCRNSSYFKPAKVKGYVMVDIGGYVTPGVYTEKQIDGARTKFNPEIMLSFARRMAVSPWSAEDRSVSGIKCVAEVLAYRAATVTSRGKDYREALRISTCSDDVGTDDILDELELQPQVVCRDSTVEPPSVGEKKERPRHLNVKDLAKSSSLPEKTDEKKVRYLLKRQEGIQEHFSATNSENSDSLMNYLVQANGLKKSESNIKLAEGRCLTDDDISKYVFKKRIHTEEPKSIETKEDRNQVKKKLQRGRGNIGEAQSRKKEAVTKALHMGLLDRQNDLDKSVLASKPGEKEELSEIHRCEVATPNEIGSKSLSDNLPSTKALVECSVSRMEDGKRSSKASQKKNEKKVAMVPNSSTKNSICGKTLEAEGEGIIANESCEEKQQMGPVAMVIDDIGPRANCVQVEDTETMDTLDELHGVHTSLVGAEKESLSANGVQQENGASLAAKTTEKPDVGFSARVCTALTQDSHSNVHPLACKPVSLAKDQETENNVGCALENGGKELHESFYLSNDSIKSQLLSSVEMDEPPHADDCISGGLESSPCEGCPEQGKADAIQLDTDFKNTAKELLVSSSDIGDADVVPSSELAASLDRAVIKKTKGFKRLVKFARSSVLQDTPGCRSYPSEENHNNETRLPGEIEPTEKRRKVSEVVESIAEEPKDERTGTAVVNSASHNYRRAAMTEDDKGCAPMLSDQSEGNEFLCREVHSENSESLLCLLMNDFLSLALDPFYGIERDCPSKVSHFFLKYRSLVYQKSLTSMSSLEASKNVQSLNEVRDLQETKNRNARRESDLLSSLSESNDPNVKDPLADENGNSEPNEVAPLTNSKMQNSMPHVFKNGRSQRLEAKENRKRKLDVQSDGSGSLKRLRKLKDLESIPKRSRLKLNGHKSSVLSRTDLKESVQEQQTKPRKSSFEKSSDSSKAIEGPMALCMKFPQGFALPSVVQLKVKFARFGPLDVSGTRIYFNSGSAQVVFKHSSDAETAYEYATENSLFGQADVSYRLKQIFQPKNEALALQSKTESSKLSRIQSEEVSPSLPAVTQEDMAPLRSLDRYGVPETPIESTPKSTLQLRPMVQLKSCLKKADELGNGTLKETARVTFQLDSGELSRTVVTAMDEHSQKENVNIPISTSLLLENNAIVNSLVENDATESAPPDISHQMLYLLMQCNDIVNEISTSLGYVPLHEL